MAVRWRRMLAITGVVVVALGGLVGYEAYSVFSSVPHLFKRNAELKADGYYMAEFELKMLAALKMLGDGDYLDAALTLRRIGQEMDGGDGLKKLPQDATPAARMTFLLDQQDPTTGAFMDPAYPAFTYISPTLNVIETLEDLSRETGRPLKLKYPLRFLDAIATPAALRSYLDGLLYMKRFWAEMFPGPGPYGAGVSELVFFDLFERNGLYAFSPAWKETLRSWLDETQDPATGMWGMRVGTPEDWYQRHDPNSTFHILHHTQTADGDDTDPAHPLRHAGELAATLMTTVTAPIPDGEDDQHAWSLDQAQATQMLVRYLWKHIDAAEQQAVKSAIAVALRERARLFRPADGAFAAYLSSERAEVDGTSSALALLKASGSIPGTSERARLWGEVVAPPAETEAVAATIDIALPTVAGVNAWRVYAGSQLPGDTLDDRQLVAIVYPGGGVLDLMDLRQNLMRYLAGPASFGNWSSSDKLRAAPLALDRPARSVPVFTGGLGAESLAILAGAGPDLALVGYDLFQRPVAARLYRIGG